ncbi:unnamed protein product [Effrenium voratum]|nr:unnamed protein product [Effrenium voratum]
MPLRRPGRAIKRPAAKPGVKRTQKVVAECSIPCGGLVFREDPLVVSQARRSNSADHQPLFCAHCGKPCGALHVNLALAAGTTSRTELLSIVRNTDGEEALARWLDFATKSKELPGAEAASGTLHVIDEERYEDLCFCTSNCRDQFCRVATESSHAVLAAANALVARAALEGCRLRSQKEVAARLRPILSCAPRARDLPVSAAQLERHHRRLARALADKTQMPKAAAKTLALSRVPLDLYHRVVAALDARSWYLSGETIQSPLGRYCEHACGHALQRRAAEAIGPVVGQLLKREEMLTVLDKQPQVSQDARQLAVPLPDPRTAKQSAVAFWPKLLTDDEIAQVKLSSERPRQGQWSTCYLHADGVAHTFLAPILQKLKDHAVHMDRQKGWNCLKGADSERLRVRCVEHHVVTSGGALPDPTHFDGGSVFTIDVMLNSPGIDFQGGDFCTLESSGELQPHSFARGDALVFLSHKAHCVQPVTSGERQTLVMELWEGEERRCNHRCEQRWGPCEVVAGAALQVDPERIREEGPRLFAHTAFEGVAFFPQVAQILRQSASSSGNVEVVFEGTGPVASVRAKRELRQGEVLVLKPEDDCESSASSE